MYLFCLFPFISIAIHSELNKALYNSVNRNVMRDDATRNRGRFWHEYTEGNEGQGNIRGGQLRTITHNKTGRTQNCKILTKMRTLNVTQGGHRDDRRGHRDTGRAQT